MTDEATDNSRHRTRLELEQEVTLLERVVTRSRVIEFTVLLVIIGFVANVIVGIYASYLRPDGTTAVVRAVDIRVQDLVENAQSISHKLKQTEAKVDYLEAELSGLKARIVILETKLGGVDK